MYLNNPSSLEMKPRITKYSSPKLQFMKYFLTRMWLLLIYFSKKSLKILRLRNLASSNPYRMNFQLLRAHTMYFFRKSQILLNLT